MPHLERFRRAQDLPDRGFDAALREVRAGEKTGHWLWYVFPQISGLGHSRMSVAFAIEDVEEARDYLRDTTLRTRLLEITRAVRDQLAARVPLGYLMGSAIDARKLVSSLTLFGAVATQLSEREPHPDFDQLASLADEVLAAAQAQGLPRCAHTLSRLGEDDSTPR